MKLLMLCREPRLYSCQRLKAAAQARDHQMDILDPNRCLLKLGQNAPHFELYYQPTLYAEPYLLPHYDAVLPRFGSSSTATGCAVLRHLQGQGSYCLNSPQAFALARDKWQSLQALAAAGVAVPDSALQGCEVSAQSGLSQLGSPTVLKTLIGSQGIGVVLAESPQSAVGMLEVFKQTHVPVLLQRFIAEANNADIRCFVVGGKVIAAMQRRGQQGEFRANCHLGGTAEKIDLTPEEQQIALHATAAIGLDVAGVDLIRAKNGLLVLEVNASPGLEMIEKTSGVDIAGEMVRFVESRMG